MMPVRVFINWDADTSWSGFDDITADVRRVTWQLGVLKSYDTMLHLGGAQIDLHNRDGKYNPENANSPLHGNMKRRRLVKIEDEDGTTSYWRGFVQAYMPFWSPAGAATGQTEAGIMCVGLEQQLIDLDVDMPLLQNTTADVVIRYIIEQIGLPPSVFGGWLLGAPGNSELGISTLLGDAAQIYSLNEGKRTLAYFGDDSLSANAFQLIADAVAAERGLFFFDREGRAVLHNLTYRIENATSLATVSETQNPPIAVDYSYGATLANLARISAKPRETGTATSTLWQLNAPVAVPAGQSIDFIANLTNAGDTTVGAENVSIGQQVYSSGTANASLEVLGNRIRVTVANSGSENAVLSDLTIVGDALNNVSSIQAAYTDNDSIVTAGRQQEVRLVLRSVDNYNAAFGIGWWEVSRRKDERGEINAFTLRRTADNVDFIRARTIGDRITVQLDGISHNADHYIIGERHSVSADGVHDATYYCQPASDSPMWLLGDPVFGLLGDTTILGF